MSYHIIKSVPAVPFQQSRRSAERATMEALDVGDGFIVDDESAMMRARSARHRLAPKRFSISKLANKGWQIRREE